MAWTFEATKAGYTAMWARIAIRADERAQVDREARRIIAGETRYRAVEKITGVPWFFIGALHMRESGCDFAGVLHNGDRIIGTGRKTYRVPAGRGPFSSWEEAAVDALKIKGLEQIKDWGPARFGYHAEMFNGLGYVGHGTNSPYVWGGSNHEQRGKYIADHVWDASVEDKQVGVMTAIKAIAEIRADVAAAINGKAPPAPVTTTSVIGGSAAAVAVGTAAVGFGIGPVLGFAAGVAVTLAVVWLIWKWRHRAATSPASLGAATPAIVSLAIAPPAPRRRLPVRRPVARRVVRSKAKRKRA